MKIYKSDGTFINNAKDTDFGWNLTEIIIDESIPFYEQQNKITFSKCTPNRDPIAVQEPVSVIDFELNNETKGHVIENIDEKSPCKTQVASLINPCSVESKMLLSVVDYTMYRNFNMDMINLEDLQNGTNLGPAADLDRTIYDGIRNYYENKSNNTVPLLIDLLLADTKCDINEIISQNDDSIDVDDCDGTFFSQAGRRGTNQVNPLDSCMIINECLEKLYTEKANIHLQVLDIKKCFLNETFRVDALIRSAQNFEKNLRETKFLDDLIHLLDGKLDKVVLKEGPFRIFQDPAQDCESNLII